MPQKYDDVIIDVAIDEPSRSSPALGQLDKLLKQSALETQSLQVVRRMLMRDMLDRAQVTGVTKLTAAAKQRQVLLTAGDGREMNGHAYAPKKKKVGGRGKNRDGRKPASERIATLRHYLDEHPGEDSHQIAKGLGWRPNQVLKFVKGIARGEEQGPRQPHRWFLRGSKPAASQPKTRKSKKLVKKSKTQRQDEIRAFLARNPEAYTKDVAKALRLFPNSSFVKVLRTVAQPARPTKATQPIPWVLQAS